MEPLIVTAHMASGIASADPWSPGLEGILTYWSAKEQHDEETFVEHLSGLVDVPEIPIPMGREEHEDIWWWQCSMPIAAPVVRSQHAMHRRFDDWAAYDRVPERVGRVETKGGRYKAGRLLRTVTHAPYVQWHCIGDAREIQRLLRYCYNIGFGHTRGLGQVFHWTIDPGGDPDIARYYRPLPVAFAAQHGITGPEMDWGFAHDRHTRIRCVMP